MFSDQGYENALLKMMGKAIGKNNNVSNEGTNNILGIPISLFLDVGFSNV